MTPLLARAYRAMERDDRYREALSCLSWLWENLEEESPSAADTIAAQTEVVKRLRPTFSVAGLGELSDQELGEKFGPSLDFKNNRHWHDIHRYKSVMCEDMDARRQGLRELVDEGRPLAQRYDTAVDLVHGLGRAVATPVLLVSKRSSRSLAGSSSHRMTGSGSSGAILATGGDRTVLMGHAQDAPRARSNEGGRSTA